MHESNTLVAKGGVKYLSLRPGLGASNSESDTSKVSTFPGIGGSSFTSR